MTPLPGSILRFVRYFVFAVLFVGISGCSLLDRINPFSSPPAPQAETTQSLIPETTGAPLIEQEAPPVQHRDPVDSTASKAVPVPKPPTQAPQNQKLAISSIEIIWQVPGEPVENYHLAYGSDKMKLDKMIVLPVGDLEKIDHPTFGPVFRYSLGGIPSGSPLFFTIQAENQYGISPKSPVQEIK